jgi:YHS domain-containing protein
VTRFILVAVLLLLVARAFWLLVDAVIRSAGGQPRPRADVPPVKLVRDPVCGTWVPPRDTLALSSGGVTHYFCSEECRRMFSQH